MGMWAWISLALSALALAIAIAALSIRKFACEGGISDSILKDLADTIEWQDKHEPWRKRMSEVAACLSAIRNELLDEKSLVEMYGEEVVRIANKQLESGSWKRPRSRDLTISPEEIEEVYPGWIRSSNEAKCWDAMRTGRITEAEARNVYGHEIVNALHAKHGTARKS